MLTSRRGITVIMATRRAGKQSFSEDRAANVLGAIEWLLTTHYGSNKAELGRAMDITGQAITQLTSGKNRPSFETAELVAQLLSKHLGYDVAVDELLAGRWQHARSGVRELVDGEAPLDGDEAHAYAIDLARRFAINNNVPSDFVKRFDLTHLERGLSSEDIYKVIKGAWIASGGRATGVARSK
jgi:transcriptional regulator with XRE-family HTH domain